MEMEKIFTFKGTWALITGAGRGIGAAAAEMLARCGVNLCIHYHKSRQQADQLAHICAKQGIEVLTVRSDLSRPDGVDVLFQQIPRTPDYLVNNAGEAFYGLISQTKQGDWDRLMRINAAAPFFISERVLPHMIHQQFGRIVNVSSLWGEKGAAGEVLYSATKGALNAFTRALAKELAPNGITVNAVAPGAIETDMVSQEFGETDLHHLAAEIPAGRLGSPEEAAAVIVFLLSDQAAYVTGEVISPSGGWA